MHRTVVYLASLESMDAGAGAPCMLTFLLRLLLLLITMLPRFLEEKRAAMPGVKIVTELEPVKEYYPAEVS